MIRIFFLLLGLSLSLLARADLNSELATNALQTAGQQQDLQQQLGENARPHTDASYGGGGSNPDVRPYVLKIMQQVRGNWTRPATARNDSSVALRISLLPGGTVSNVVVIRSSGDADFDKSATTAVMKTSPLAVPEDADLFNKHFRSLTLHLKAED